MKLKIFFYYLFLFLFKVSVFGGVSNPLTPDGLKECWELYTNEPDEFLSRNKDALIETLEIKNKIITEECTLAEKLLAERRSQINLKIKREEKFTNALAEALEVERPERPIPNVELAQDYLQKKKNKIPEIMSYTTFEEFKSAIVERLNKHWNEIENKEMKARDFIDEKIPLYDVKSLLIGSSYLSRNRLRLNEHELRCEKENIEKIKEGNIKNVDPVLIVYLLGWYHTHIQYSNNNVEMPLDKSQPSNPEDSLSSARIEAGNVGIRMIRKRARGIKDTEYLKLKIRQPSMPEEY